jgi:hypothetical protein
MINPPANRSQVREQGYAAVAGEPDTPGHRDATHGFPAVSVLDEAEAAARDLLRRFPDVHDGWNRLGMVHEARGDSRQAADCYRKVIAFIRDHPDDYETGFEEVFVKLVDRLDPPTAT